MRQIIVPAASQSTLSFTPSRFANEYLRKDPGRNPGCCAHDPVNDLRFLDSGAQPARRLQRRFTADVEGFDGPRSWSAPVTRDFEVRGVPRRRPRWQGGLRCDANGACRCAEPYVWSRWNRE